MTIDSTSYPLKLLSLFSGSALKIIAVLSMVTDHCAYYLLDGNTWAYEVMRCFGRVAFPVFAFLVAEGFAHTRNRMRYFLSLLLFAVISEVPWYLLNGADGTHNVMFTLALGVAALAVFERLQKHGALAIAAILLVALSAEISGLDYGWHGIVEILVFHLFRSKKYCQSTRLLQLAFAFPFMSHYGIIGALLACFIIFLYNGTRGIIHGKVAKYGFYAIYPVHLIIIKLFFH
ncbi:TraX family protein [uncultured Bacteroides sp.]|uniref:TraX family protein n=1 Tax=uncultured Bacteroides sp. TaxID=162156 RepID=UPI00258A2B10|nr:TraX family protein [uncultured Bacteroides sp.]